MNSLEYIDKQILFVKQNIQYHKDLLTTTDDDESIEIIKSTIRLLEPELQTLQQIKSELEAWEICKNKLNLKVQTEEAITEGFCMKGYWLLVEQYPYTQTTIIEQEEYDILKKALEEEYEESK